MSLSPHFEVVPLTELAAKGLERDENPPKPIVLVVDDEALIADTLTAIFRQNGLAAMAAYDGGSALEMARLVPPDLLLTDVVMPGMSGIELASAVVRVRPECNVILFSGQAATKALLSKAGQAWCDFEVLLKPIHPQRLLELIFQRLHVDAGKQPCGRAQENIKPRLDALR